MLPPIFTRRLSPERLRLITCILSHRLQTSLPAEPNLLALVAKPLPSVVLLMFGVIAFGWPDAADTIAFPTRHNVHMQVRNTLGRGFSIRLNNVQSFGLHDSRHRLRDPDRGAGEMNRVPIGHRTNVTYMVTRDYESVTKRRWVRRKKCYDVIVTINLADVWIFLPDNPAKWAVALACRHYSPSRVVACPIAARIRWDADSGDSRTADRFSNRSAPAVSSSGRVRDDTGH
jgi:hypothetical protein